VSAEKSQAGSETWSAHFDHREDEELAWHLWAQSLAAREQALAQPIVGLIIPDELVPSQEPPEAAADPAQQ
jgi:hypothetical protein